MTTPPITLPLPDLSGLVVAQGHGGPALLGVGDALRTLLRLPWAAPLDPRAVELIPLPLPELDGGSQLEAVDVDAAGLVYVLDETRALAHALAVAGGAATLRHSFALVVPPGHPLRKAWDKRPNKRGEGLLVLPGGHLLVAKQTEPMALVEFGPAGDAAHGVQADPAPAQMALPPGPTSELVPLAVWEPDANAQREVDSLNDLARGPDGALYLVASHPRATIARLRLPLAAGGGTFSFAATWTIATPRHGKAEGLAFHPDGRVAVGLDATGDGPNLLLLAPLP